MPNADWKDFNYGAEADGLVLAARAIVPERARERADPRVIEQIRRHHFRLERLLVESAGDDFDAWDLRVAYRGDTVIVACAPDKLMELVVAAWTMVDGRDRQDLPTCIGLSRESVLDVAGFRPDLPASFPVSTDLQGLGVERALALVHDFADEGQVLLSGDLIEIDCDEVEQRIPSNGKRHVRLNPVKDQALVLHSDLEFLPVGQLAWDQAAPGDLTNRHEKWIELKRLQPKLSELSRNVTLTSGVMLILCTGDEGRYKYEEVSKLLGDGDGGFIQNVMSVWKDSPEIRRPESDLGESVGKLEKDFNVLIERLHDLHAAINHHDEDSGRSSEARIVLLDAWSEFRNTAHQLNEQVAETVRELYT